jgi:hypothetical protein
MLCCHCNTDSANLAQWEQLMIAYGARYHGDLTSKKGDLVGVIRSSYKELKLAAVDFEIHVVIYVFH